MDIAMAILMVVLIMLCILTAVVIVLIVALKMSGYQPQEMEECLEEKDETRVWFYGSADGSYGDVRPSRKDISQDLYQVRAYRHRESYQGARRNNHQGKEAVHLCSLVPDGTSPYRGQDQRREVQVEHEEVWSGVTRHRGHGNRGDDKGQKA